MRSPARLSTLWRQARACIALAARGNLPGLSARGGLFWLICMAAVCGLAGCFGPEVFARPRAGIDPRPPAVYLVIVSRDPPPPGSLQVGEVAFFSHVTDLPEALSKLRARAYRLGGSLVAPLRCRPESRYHEARRFDFAEAERLSPGERIHCYGKVWRIP